MVSLRADKQNGMKPCAYLMGYIVLYLGTYGVEEVYDELLLDLRVLKREGEI